MVELNVWDLHIVLLLPTAAVALPPSSHDLGSRYLIYSMNKRPSIKVIWCALNADAKSDLNY